jgi:hypothetical protein
MTAYAWTPTGTDLGTQAIDATSTVQNHPLGTIRKARHATFGEGEFIYLLGVTGTAAGLLVRYNATTYQTVVLVNTAVQACPVAVAMSANIGSQWGWYQIEGNTTVLKTAVAITPTVAVYISGTAGRVKLIASAGLQIVGCRSANLTTVTSTTSSVVLTINRPHCQSQIT